MDMRDNESHSRFTDTELEIARGTDLPTLLESLGYNITRKGRFHSTTEMDSLRIKNRRTWFRYSENVGGDAITFLEHFQGMTFTDAVRHLLAFNGYARDMPVLRPRPTPPALPAETGAPVPFVLPPAHTDQKRVYAYLRKRGICHQVVAGFIDAELLYEDADHHNCVFVGKDSEDTPIFAFKRGTYDQGGSGFKGDVEGSDKSVAFALPCDPAKTHVSVFESPIDLMSYMTLHRELTGNAVALCCLHDGALETYLSAHPHIKEIRLCLDSDKWGLEAASRIKEKYVARGYSVASLLPPRGKDWNEYLQFTKQKTNQKEK